MLRFQLPQNIDIKDKVVGPFTFQQALYLAGGIGLAYVWWQIIPRVFSIFLSLATLGLAGLFAFYKKDKRPFVKIVQSFFKYQTSPRMYLWKQRKRDANTVIEDAQTIPKPPIQPGLTNSKLKNLSWGLDVLDQ